MKTATGRVYLDPSFEGRSRIVAVYDLAGHLLLQKQIDKNMIDLRRDFGMAGGVYIVRVQPGGY